MNPVKIIIDSTSDLRQEEIEAYDLTVVPLLVTFEDKTYRDGVDLHAETLFQKVEETGELPKTAARSPIDYIESFRPFIEKGCDILCITISSEMSSTFQAACTASEEFEPQRIRVIDSRNLSSGIGLIILKACRFRREGMGLHDIADKLEKEIIPNVRSQFVVETLTYLHKGGRCTSTAHFFGRMLKIHPEIVVRDGKMSVYRKPRGKMINAYNELLDMIREDLPRVDLDTVMITHSIAPEGVKYLYEELSKMIPKESIMITQAGCVICSHCGPATIGILYILKP